MCSRPVVRRKKVEIERIMTLDSHDLVRSPNQSIGSCVLQELCDKSGQSSGVILKDDDGGFNPTTLTLIKSGV